MTVSWFAWFSWLGCGLRKASSRPNVGHEVVSFSPRHERVRALCFRCVPALLFAVHWELNEFLMCFRTGAPNSIPLSSTILSALSTSSIFSSSISPAPASSSPLILVEAFVHHGDVDVFVVHCGPVDLSRTYLLVQIVWLWKCSDLLAMVATSLFFVLSFFKIIGRLGFVILLSCWSLTLWTFLSSFLGMIASNSSSTRHASSFRTSALPMCSQFRSLPLRGP